MQFKTLLALAAAAVPALAQITGPVSSASGSATVLPTSTTTATVTTALSTTTVTANPEININIELNNTVNVYYYTTSDCDWCNIYTTSCPYTWSYINGIPYICPQYPIVVAYIPICNVCTVYTYTTCPYNPTTIVPTTYTVVPSVVVTVTPTTVAPVQPVQPTTVKPVQPTQPAQPVFTGAAAANNVASGVFALAAGAAAMLFM